MNYKAAPTRADTKSRRARKADRNAAFIHNMTLRRKLNREKRKGRIE